MRKLIMFEYDICLCGNADKCPMKDTCLRAIKPPPGIYTISLFYNKDKECENYIERKKNVKF